MKKEFGLIRILFAATLAVCVLAACGDDDGGGGVPEGYTNADMIRGGRLYDKFWSEAGVAEPMGDHPLWATRPDTASNTRAGSDTWRCKECHGWDYKGVDGAYGSGSHRTGIAGILGTTLSPQETFDLIKTGHGYGGASLADADIWDLAKFVREGTIDTATIIDGMGAFTGSAANGATLYAASCESCHGADGRTINFATPPEEEYVGDLAVGNPWEVQHKIRFGHPNSPMPSLIANGGSTQDVADIGAHAQTLDASP